MLRLYISGPIGGRLRLPPGHPQRVINESAFFDAEVVLYEKGHRPENPMRLNVHQPDASWENKLRIDIGVLVKCDGIVMLREWQDSPGAELERLIAMRLKLDIFYGVEQVPLVPRVLVEAGVEV